MDCDKLNKAIEVMKAHHRKQFTLCDELEALADRLPNFVDNQHCLTIARQIFPIVRKAHEFEEQTLFPILSTIPSSDTELFSSLERLRFEHWEDESFAEDLSESLRQYGCSGDTGDGEKLAYMLRGFFDGLRRHIAFEAEHLVPILEAEINRTVH